MKAIVLLALPFMFLADSAWMPWVPWLDLSLDMLIGWLCLGFAVILAVAGAIQRWIGPEGAARRTFLFAALALLVGVVLSPMLAIR